MVRTPCSWRFTKWLARSMPQHVPGSASQPFWWRGLRVAGAYARHGTLGPSDSEATLLQLGRPALRMSSKHEVAFIFTPHDGSE